MDIRAIREEAEQCAIQAALAYLERKGFTKEKAKDLITELFNEIPNLKGFMRPYVRGVSRWFGNGELKVGNINDYRRVNSLLTVLRTSPALDDFDYNFCSWITGQTVSFAETAQMVGVDLDCFENETIPTNTNYNIVEIKSHGELRKYEKYAAKWCVMGSDESIFNHYTVNGTNKFYLCFRDDYKDVKAIPGQGFPNDSYGLSMIAVIKDPEGNISSITTRWNAESELDEGLTMDYLKVLVGDF